MSQKALQQGRNIFIEEIRPDSKTLARLDAYVALLGKWQPRINLIGRSTLESLWVRHFLDSAQLYWHLPKATKTLIDLGSGGGFPGLVLAVLLVEVGGPTVTLIESDSRKAAFLREANRVCGAHAEILNVRAEGANFAPADVVTARACAPFRRLLPLVHRCLLPNGLALLMKGAGWRPELTAARKDWKMKYSEIPSVTDEAGIILRLKGLRPN